jgi:hypothetical protein
MLLIDLAPKNISSHQVEKIIDKVGILANRNPLPGNVGPRFSGLRLATPLMVIRGMDPNDFEVVVADLIHEVIEICIRQSREARRTEERCNETKSGIGGEEPIILSELQSLKMMFHLIYLIKQLGSLKNMTYLSRDPTYPGRDIILTTYADVHFIMLYFRIFLSVLLSRAICDL